MRRYRPHIHSKKPLKPIKRRPGWSHVYASFLPPKRHCANKPFSDHHVTTWQTGRIHLAQVRSKKIRPLGKGRLWPHYPGALKVVAIKGATTLRLFVQIVIHVKRVEKRSLSCIPGWQHAIGANVVGLPRRNATIIEEWALGKC